MSKKLTVLLGTVLVLTLAFGSAAFAVNPTPTETRYDDYGGGTVTFKISFDLEATDGLVTNPKAGNSQASTP